MQVLRAALVSTPHRQLLHPGNSGSIPKSDATLPEGSNRGRKSSGMTMTHSILNHEERFILNGGESDVQNL
jgi:hypothetical protein